MRRSRQTAFSVSSVLSVVKPSLRSRLAEAFSRFFQQRGGAVDQEAGVGGDERHAGALGGPLRNRVRRHDDARADRDALGLRLRKHCVERGRDFRMRPVQQAPERAREVSGAEADRIDTIEREDAVDLIEEPGISPWKEVKSLSRTNSGVISTWAPVLISPNL